MQAMKTTLTCSETRLARFAASQLPLKHGYLMISLTKINLTNNSYNVSHLLTPKLSTMARFKDRPIISSSRTSLGYEAKNKHAF